VLNLEHNRPIYGLALWGESEELMNSIALEVLKLLVCSVVGDPSVTKTWASSQYILRRE
jgi:hypothetical protein